MVYLHKIFIPLFLLFVLAGCASSEKARLKKRKARGKGKNPLKKQETLEQLCQANRSRGSRKNILELQAFFNLNKSFACLKMETCERIPVCFVEDTPDLEHSSLDNCALWNLLNNLKLKVHRKIEPVSEHPMNSVNGGKSRTRTDYSWDDALSSLCDGANVYRFVTEDLVHEINASTNGTLKNSSSTSIVSPPTSEATNASSTRSQYTLPRKNRHRRGGPLNRFLKQMKKRQNAGNNSSCNGHPGCTRICVGQNEKPTNVSDCSTFKIHCTLSSKVLSGNRRKQKGKSKKRNGKSRK